MPDRINRRSFLAQGAAFGITAAAGSSLLSEFLEAAAPPKGVDISVAAGNDPYANTLKSVEQLGGISKFVRRGATVGLLINSVWDSPGTFTHPDVSLAVLKMCLDAGAKQVYSIEGARDEYWRRSKRFDAHKNLLKRLSMREARKKIRIEKGKSLKEAELSTALLECDVLINIPIVKQHQGTNFTATLKNMMGACTSSTNRFFHSGSGARGGYDDIPFLSQCIADLNLVRQAQLCVVDATEFVTSNGPAGPGELKRLRKVLSGTNQVSVDAYCATLLGRTPADVQMIAYASRHGLGEMNLSKLSVKEISA